MGDFTYLEKREVKVLPYGRTEFQIKKYDRWIPMCHISSCPDKTYFISRDIHTTNRNFANPCFECWYRCNYVPNRKRRELSYNIVRYFGCRERR